MSTTRLNAANRTQDVATLTTDRLWQRRLHTEARSEVRPAAGHVDDPGAAAREIARVLRPGGDCILVTPEDRGLSIGD